MSIRAFLLNIKPIMDNKSKIILLADDDLDDQELLEEAFLQLERDAAIHTVSSAKEVLAYLQSCTEKELPCLIVLDYNMPDFSGAEVLRLLASHEQYKNIPAIIWSTSDSQIYKNICEERGARFYFHKPANFKDIAIIARQMLQHCNVKVLRHN